MAVVVAMLSSTPCSVAGVDIGFIHPLWRGCGAGRGNGYKASLSCRGFWVPDLLQHNPGSKIHGSGGRGSKNAVFDGMISATSPHLLTR